MKVFVSRDGKKSKEQEQFEKSHVPTEVVQPMKQGAGISVKSIVEDNKPKKVLNEKPSVEKSKLDEKKPLDKTIRGSGEQTC
jgi:hypothetical protein